MEQLVYSVKSCAFANNKAVNITAWKPDGHIVNRGSLFLAFYFCRTPMPVGEITTMGRYEQHFQCGEPMYFWVHDRILRSYMTCFSGTICHLLGEHDAFRRTWFLDVWRGNATEKVFVRVSKWYGPSCEEHCEPNRASMAKLPATNVI